MKNQKGITLVALTITIIVMIIIASITTYAGSGLIKQAKLQDLVTNMLLMQVKAKEGAEEAKFQKVKDLEEAAAQFIIIGTKVAGSGISELEEKVSQILGTTENCYYFTQEDLQSMGLKDLTVSDYGYFVAVYDIDNIKAEIINTKGYNGKYKLEDLKALQEEQE